MESPPPTEMSSLLRNRDFAAQKLMKFGQKYTGVAGLTLNNVSVRERMTTLCL